MKQNGTPSCPNTSCENPQNTQTPNYMISFGNNKNLGILGSIPFALRSLRPLSERPGRSPLDGRMISWSLTVGVGGDDGGGNLGNSSMSAGFCDEKYIGEIKYLVILNDFL